MKVFLKIISISSFIVLAGFFVMFLGVSCQRDKCKATRCANGGICSDGVCKCKPGFVGTTCDTLSKLNFIGAWTVNETGSSSPKFSYALSINDDTLATNVIIKNLFNYFYAVRATINGDTITIPNQQMQGKVVFGTGFICPSETHGRYGAIVMRYEVIDTAHTDVVDDFGYYPLLYNSAASNWVR